MWVEEVLFKAVFASFSDSVRGWRDLRAFFALRASVLEKVQIVRLAISPVEDEKISMDRSHSEPVSTERTAVTARL